MFPSPEHKYGLLTQTDISRQEDFLRPSAEEDAYISSLVASRRAQVDQAERVLSSKEGGLVTPSSRGATTGASTQDLEFGGVGLFGRQSDDNYEVTERQDIDNHQRHEEENPASTPMTMQSMRGGNIYDMAAYVKPAQEESRPVSAEKKFSGHFCNFIIRFNSV